MIFSPDGSDILGAPGYKRTAGEGMKQKGGGCASTKRI
jgi:hypothetical protein